MTEVKFGEYLFNTEEKDGKKYIFDVVRKKFVFLSPEEWVRQHIIHYLIDDRGVSKSLLAVERGIELNGLKKRFDIVVFSNSGKPKMIIECKAPNEKLSETVFEQIARYNLSLNVDYLWVTNGHYNFCCRLMNRIELLSVIPTAAELK